jgi:hypothetical protein
MALQATKGDENLARAHFSLWNRMQPTAGTPRRLGRAEGEVLDRAP